MDLSRLTVHSRVDHAAGALAAARRLGTRPTGPWHLSDMLEEQTL